MDGRSETAPAFGGAGAKRSTTSKPQPEDGQPLQSAGAGVLCCEEGQGGHSPLREQNGVDAAEASVAATASDSANGAMPHVQSATRRLVSTATRRPDWRGTDAF